jgi:Tol biopolymer transport system component
VTVPSGVQIGPYEIQQLIGAGGMGEVYRARDARLNRDVALKVLPEAFTLDADRLARFHREAQLLASLNHPNIAAIYGLEESTVTAGLRTVRLALVLEFVEGLTLADRIARGPLPLEDALSIAKQIAEALEAAHQQSIIHRDLKPANIKLRHDGCVKVLDFGLAKLAARPDEPAPRTTSGGGPSLTESPTIASPLSTAVGSFIGSAAYMSPEQARGRAVDKRSDVWAFGCLLYEMLTGRRAFEADDVSGSVAAILERQPAWERLPAATPPSIRRLLRRCLEKDPRRRLCDFADARLEIEDAMSSVDDEIRQSVGLPRTGIGAALVGTAIATAVIVWVLKPAPHGGATTSDVVQRFLIAPSEPISESEGVLVISRDGRRIAYAAGQPGRQQLFVREVDQFASKPIPETEGVVSAAFSPDGQSIAFLADRKLRTVRVAGGMPLTLRDRVDGAGVTWTIDQAILYNPGTATGIWRIPIGGGEPAAVTQPGLKDNEQRFPEVLPGGKGLLFSARGGVTDDQVYVESLVTHERRMLATGAAPHYLPNGYLAFVQAGTLVAVRFDPTQLEAKGAPITLLEGVGQARSGQPLISYSDVGSIVYVPSSAEGESNALVWVDFAGNELPAGAAGRPWAQPRLSPDGHRVVTSLRSTTEDLWLIDLDRGTSSRLTTESNTSFPVWAPDGRRLAFAAAKRGSYGIYWRPVDGSAPDEQLIAGDWPHYPFSWSPDGKLLAFVSVNPKSLQDIRVLNVDRRGSSQAFLETPFREGGPVFSPDGKWIAYVSDESGRFETYVRPYPGPGEKWPISNGGGSEPVWRRDGRQLFYRAGDTVMVVDVQTSPTFAASKARRLFERAYERSIALWANYDTSPDNRRLLMVRRESASTPAIRINVVLNWLEELKQKMPAE